MRVLLLGYSSIARRRVIPALKKIRLVSEDIEVCCQDRSKYLNSPHDNSLRFLSCSYEEAINTSNADLVYVSTHNQLHYYLAKLALERNKHVICDKPCCCMIDQSYELLDLAEAHGKGISEASVYLHHTQIHDLLKYLESLDEKLVYLHAEFTIPNLADNNFRYKKNLGGGAILDMGVYAMTIGKIFFGTSPLATKCIKTSHKSYDVETSFCILQDFGQGQMLTGAFGFGLSYSNKIYFDTGSTKGCLKRVFSSDPNIGGIIELESDIKNSTIHLGPCDAFHTYFNRILHDFDRGEFDYSRMMLYESATMLQILQCEAARNG